MSCRELPILFVVVFAIELFPIACRAAEPKEKEKEKKNVLCAVDADGGNRRVVFQHDEYVMLGSPAVSPDGMRIGLDARKEEESYSDTHILIVNRDGSGMVDLGDGAMPSWSADMTRLAFSRYHPSSGVWTMAIDGTDQQLVDSSGWGIQWSPDGRKLAYTRGGNIVIHDIETGESRDVWPDGETPYSRVYWNMTWDPDSRRICFVGPAADQEKELAMIDVEEGPASLKRLFLGRRMGSDMAWHPDGRRIVFSALDPTVRLVQFFQLEDPWIAGPTLFPDQDRTQANAQPSWSPDGKTLVFVSRAMPARPVPPRLARQGGGGEVQEGWSVKEMLILGNIAVLLLLVVLVAVRRAVSGHW